jgi:hypothetical protein
LAAVARAAASEQASVAAVMAVLAFMKILRLNNMLASGAAAASPFDGAFVGSAASTSFDSGGYRTQ